MSSREVPDPNPFAAVVALSRDDTAPRVREPTAHGALHWAPQRDVGYEARMATIAAWVRDARPEVFVVDVSVEVAMLVRLLGVPVVVMALPGERTDAPHLMVHRLADHIIAAWPRDLCEPAWLRPYRDKTTYAGGISRFEHRRPSPKSETNSTAEVLVLGGADGVGTGDDDRTGYATVMPDADWTVLGGAGGTWTDDPWPQICAADVVVTHAGQNCIADVAAAQRPAVVIPQARPYVEQYATARTLCRHRLAVVTEGWPDRRAWPALLARARRADPQRWLRWQVQGAAARAARAIEATAYGAPP